MNTKSILAGAAAGLLALAAQADDALNTAAKKIFTDKKDCVVYVTAIAKTSFSGDSSQDKSVNVPDQENKMESLGTVIDPSGLVVTVLGQIDPSRAITGRSVRTAQGIVKLEASSVLKDVKVTMPDGTEIPAEIVMKDADLDLAFVRIKTSSPEAKGVTFTAVDLKDNASGDVLDEVVTLTRMDETLNRAANVSRGQINMITKKPRTFLRASGATGGCPTFLSNGKILGITAGRMQTGKPAWAVIIPAADVLEIAEQTKSSRPAAATETKK